MTPENAQDQTLVVKADELKELINYVHELPTKYGLPILNFINATAQKRAQETAKAVDKSEASEG